MAATNRSKRLGILRTPTSGLSRYAMMLCAMAVAPIASAAVSDNLAGHYKMDETDGGSLAVTNSAPGAAENATRTAGLTVNQAGVVNTAYGFGSAGTTDFMTLGTSIAHSLLNTDQLTISAWVNPSSYRTGTAASSRHTIVGANSSLSLSLYAQGNLYFNFRGTAATDDGSNSTGTNNLAGGMTVPLNQYSFIAATRNGPVVSMYINGILVGQKLSASTGNFVITAFDYDNNPATAADVGLYGGHISPTATSAREFDGKMDELGIWAGKALSQKEIALVAGLSGTTHAVDLGSSAVDDVLSTFNAQGTTTASAGGFIWSYNDLMPAPADASTMYVGKNYTGADGKFYIILDGTTNAFTGVTTATVPTIAQATWDGGGNGNWNTGADWVGDTAPSFTSSAPSRLIFTGAGQTANNDVSSAVVAGVTFDAAAGSFTITGNGFTVIPGATKSIRNNSANTQTFTTGAIAIASASIDAAAGPLVMNSDLNIGTTGVSTLRGASTITVNGKISGAGSIDKRDSGTVILANATNDFTGALTVYDGALQANNAGALGSAAGTIVAAGGASTGYYDFNGSMTVAKPITLAARTGTSAAYAPSISNHGTNTLSGDISITGGGTLAGISSESGKLLVSGNVTNNLGSSTAVTALLGGAGEGDFSGTTANGTGTGAFGVTKVGTGTWTLSSATKTYTGPTNVMAGTLKVQGAPIFSAATSKTTIMVESAAVLDLTGISSYELQIGQTLRGKGIVKAGTLTAYDDNSIKPGDDSTGSVGTLGVQGNLSLLNQFAPPAAGTNLSVDLGNTTTVGGGVNDLLDVSGNLTLDSSAGAIRVNVNPVSGYLATGSYQLIRYGGSKSGSATWNVSLPLTSGYRAMPTVDDSPSGHVDLVVPAGLALTWKGDGSANAWNVNSTANWNNNTEKFYQMDRVTFDDSSNNTTVNITVPVYPGSVTVNSSKDYTISGNGSLNTLSGGFLLTKMGSGNLTMTNVNTGTWNVNYTGYVQVLGGTLSIAHVGQLAQNLAADRVLLDGGALRFIGATAGNTGRLFTLGAGGGVIDSSGGAALTLGGTGNIEFTGSGPRTLTLAGSFAGTNTLAANLGDGPGGATALIKSGVTGWNLTNLANSFTGGVTVNAGTLALSGRVAGGPLAVNGGLLKIAAKAVANDPTGTSVATSLAIADGAQFDLTNNSAIIDYTTVGTLVDDVRQHLANGRLITTSTGGKVGYGDNALLGKASFSGQSPDSTSLLIKFTYGGDGNLDGQVDISDLGSLATSWQTSAPWTGGDFDYSGFVDISDLGILATNWQLGVGSPLGPSFDQALTSVGLGSVTVPEPTTLGLALLGAWSLKRPRRSIANRKSEFQNP